MDGYAIENLWQAHNARVKVWALCRRCGHVKGIDPYNIIKQAKSGTSDKSLWEVARRLKCGNCHMHDSVLIPGIPDPGGRPKDYRRR